MTIIYGLSFPIILLIFVSLSISKSPWYTLTEYWFSNLGGMQGELPIYTAREGSLFFNLGLIFSGIIGSLFAISIMKNNYFNTKLGRIGRIILLIDLTTIIFIGLFPGTIMVPHRIFSAIFFLGCPCLMFFLRDTVKKDYGTLLYWILNILCIYAIFQLSLELIFKDVIFHLKSVYELIVTINIFLFCIIFSLKLLHEEKSMNITKLTYRLDHHKLLLKPSFFFYKKN